jgi:hypothetical protein
VVEQIPAGRFSDSWENGKCSNSVRFALVEGSKILLFEAAAWVSGMLGILIG